jgi:predicted phage terminase large subunit-like protein
MQRWHEDDIVGKLLKAAEHGGEQWDYIRLPAIAEEDEVWYEGNNGPVGRLKGELLWPDRITEKELAETRMGVGEYGWQAAYQQNPQPLDGVLFRQEDFGHWVAHELFYELRNGYGVTKSIAKNTCRRIMSLDMAGSDAARADYSAIQVWDVTPRGEMILLFSDRLKAKFPDLKKRVTELYLAHRPAYILAENNGMQNAICDDLLSSGLPISKQPPISSKEVRAQPLLMKYQEKYIYHPDEIYGYTWAREYEYELLKFPMGRYDDQVDAASLVGADVRSLTDAGDTNYLAGTPLSVNSGIGGF